VKEVRSHVRYAPLGILCLASYEKGMEFLRECKRQGCHVMLMTNERRAEGAWPRESIDELFVMPDLWKREDMMHTVSYLARTRHIDRIVALDDYDVEMAAILREHLRIPGMGSTTGRYLRDKLAMRLQADEHGVLVPEFVHVLNYDRLREYMERIPPPWILKPRTEAATFGIRKVQSADELWPILDGMGDRQSYYVLERFVPGDVYHVDAITYEREVLFAEVHKYGKPPFNVAHEGDIFTSRTLPRDSAEVEELRELNVTLLDALNFVRGVTHTEFIKGTTGESTSWRRRHAWGALTWWRWWRLLRASTYGRSGRRSKWRAARSLRSASPPPGIRGHPGIARPSGVPRHERLLPTLRSSGGCTSSTTSV
jgi:hypothetical protein